MMILKKAPLSEDILTLGVEGVNQIWRDTTIRPVWKKRTQTLIEAVRHSVRTKEGAKAARIETRMLLEDYEARNNRLQEVMLLIEGMIKKEMPMAEKLMEIIGKNPEFGARYHYYTARKINSLKKLQSLMAVKAKLIRVFYAILTKGVEYDPAKILEDICRLRKK